MKSFVFARALAVARKEVYHVVRDPFTLGAALGLPIFMVVVFGVAIEFNVKDIALAVSDADQSQSSKRLIETFASSHYFKVNHVDSPTVAIENLTSEKARAALVIPLNFESDLWSGRGASAQMLLDGSDGSTVAPVLGYIGAIQKLADEKIARFTPTPPYEVRARYLFNPELNSKWFVIPGLNVLVMGILTILLTALTIAREYESGSMELLLSTPIQPLEIIIGKSASYAVLGVISITFIYLVARFAFGVPFVGNHFVFGAGALLFLLAYLGQGLLISLVTRSQQVAMQLAMLSGMLPIQLLSGFVFPIESMPPVVRYFTALLPARWFMEISRDTFLKGTSLIELWVPFVAIAAFAMVVISLGSADSKGI